MSDEDGYYLPRDVAEAICKAVHKANVYQVYVPIVCVPTLRQRLARWIDNVRYRIATAIYPHLEEW